MGHAHQDTVETLPLASTLPPQEASTLLVLLNQREFAPLGKMATRDQYLELNGTSMCPTEKQNQGFPGGSAVKNPPANAGDTGSIPSPGRPHMPQSS